MSLINTAVIKQPFKLIEIPLNKFHNEAVPHHRAVLEAHKNAVRKYININNTEELSKEIKDKKRIVRQLKDLMYELDTLRAQVEDCDLNKFDAQTLSLRRTLLELVSSYTKLETEATNLIQQRYNLTEDLRTKDNTFNAPQLQIQENITDLKLREREQTLQQVEALHQDIEDVHEIFTDLNQIVTEQGDDVNKIETNVEVANENVSGGLQQLMKASRLKKASYPVAGAFIGTVVGGPIGSVAGFKIGGLVAVACGFAGYFGGKFIKNVNEEEDSRLEMEYDGELNIADNVVREKKDI